MTRRAVLFLLVIGCATAMGTANAAAVAADAAASAGPVWEVRSDQGVVLLGGTLHLLRAEDYPLPRVFDAAWDASTELWLEVDLAELNTPAVQQMIAARGMYADGGSLDQDLSMETWQAVVTFCSERGIPFLFLQRMRAPLASLTLSVAELQRLGVSEMGLDQYYYQRARAEGRTIRALETAADQLDLLLSMDGFSADEIMRYTLRDLDEAGDVMSAATVAWRSGDMARVDTLMLAPTRDEFPRSYARLMTDRNNAWMDDLAALARSPEVELVLVGTAHLAGPDSILDMLAERGFQLRPYLP